MKKNLFFIFLLSIYLVNAGNTCKKEKRDFETTLDIMSFNIRMNYKDDGTNNWQFRREYMTDLIKSYKPDLLGTEESYYPQYKDMKSLLTDYGTFGPAEGWQGAESVAIFYRKEHLTRIDSGIFWLSETPDKQSIGWDASLRRTVCWGAFKVRSSNQKVYFFVTHFDHKGKKAQEESSKLLLKKVQEIAGDAHAFIAGDFNMRATSPYYKLLTSGYDTVPPLYDTRILAETYQGPSWTLHDFGSIPVEKRPTIDYIFTNKKVKVTHYVNIAEQRGDLYPSDHNPQMATVVF
ncbi:endonuclease/exonuclease/phosphatase family protein [Parapedobacter sp. SGR-10]|uniref:endonuclease/exonuclease/phosphatase family protein n=1 Tax=Parapedobacter sp. SGR-10 TaxID=2710879 RepID=UPI0013D65F71|nr:endonuclease/exonuclease/phosphatase family protein [Parapedobacter sp. SGR-10]NGF55932.1 endonuclease/exonuclease/phosphatase family protein [Parapedobacter sp. SGR-10]